MDFIVKLKISDLQDGTEQLPDLILLNFSESNAGHGRFYLIEELFIIYACSIVAFTLLEILVVLWSL